MTIMLMNLNTKSKENRWQKGNTKNGKCIQNKKKHYRNDESIIWPLPEHL